MNVSGIVMHVFSILFIQGVYIEYKSNTSDCMKHVILGSFKA